MTSGLRWFSDLFLGRDNSLIITKHQLGTGSVTLAERQPLLRPRLCDFRLSLAMIVLVQVVELQVAS